MLLGWTGSARHAVPRGDTRCGQSLAYHEIRRRGIIVGRYQVHCGTRPCRELPPRCSGHRTFAESVASLGPAVVAEAVAGWAAVGGGGAAVPAPLGGWDTATAAPAGLYLG